ncbi:MAG: class I SAM-dependent methyltransferase [Chitinophagaceae bacterium]|nr:class I SAM-dependent methyltransferase [Chitinophagaceae bacterium]
MQESLLPILRCPVTRTALTLTIIKQAEKVYNNETVTVIEEGVLYATADWFYPILKGVPRLTVEAFLDHEIFLSSADNNYAKLKENLLKKFGALIKYAVKKNKRTKASFTKEWSVYNYDKDKTWDANDEGMVERFLKETAETRVSLKDKIIFDAGCGNGKLESLIASNCGSIIAMDFANSIEDAYARNNFSNVFFIQGDVQFPPVPFMYFDIVHCSGVLIHTNNAELSFSCIEPTVKEGGKLSVWLYHPVKDRVHRLFNRIRSVTSKLPLTFQYYLYGVTIFPLSYCIKKLKGNKQNAREMMVSILDWFTPEFRSEHEHTEAAAWFNKRGYNQVNITTVDHFGFNITGEKQNK